MRNTPIIESGAIGAAMGLALDGFRPMVEMQFGDFITCGFNQIVNNLAKTHYRWGGAVPVVMRAAGRRRHRRRPVPLAERRGVVHATCAGLKVVAPATPYDAKGLLLAALEDGNPVLFLEHKLLYRCARGPVPEGYYTMPIGRAADRPRGRGRDRRDLRRRRRLGARRRPRRWPPRATTSR